MADKAEPSAPELSSLDPTPTATAPPAAPAKPPRPLSPMQQNKLVLKEAFPSVEDNVIEAVLIASGGNIEPAFNALLAMTDPTYKPEATDAVPRYNDPSQPVYPTSTPLTQLEQDEQLARQIAGQGPYRRQDRRPSRDRQQVPAQHQRTQGQGQGQGKEHSFIDDDLPIIRDNFRKGWSTLVSKVKSKLDGEPEQPPPQPPRPGQYGYHQQTSRYDADPRVLGDDFSHLNIQEQNRVGAPKQSHRPLANPNLFKTARFSNSEADTSLPPTKSPRPEEQTSLSPQTGGPSPNKKWEPLRPAEDRDPFAVGDSDDEDGKDDLYGTSAPKKPATGQQETRVVSQTPLDSAVSEHATKHM